MAFLEIKNLSKKYKDQIVLDNVNLSLPSTGLVVIKGESGSGKSTLLKCILGIIKFDKGEIFFKNKKIKNFEKFRNEFTGYIFQNYSLISFLSPKENISIFDNNFSLSEITKSVNITEKLTQNTKTLSGGEKQRIAISRALVSKVSLLFCDEPTGSLDKDNAVQIMNLLKEISKNRLVILVTHNEEFISKYSDIILEINNGQVNQKQINKVCEVNLNNANKKELSLKNNILIIKKLIKDNFKKLLFSLISLSCSIGFLLMSLTSFSYSKNQIEQNKTKFLNYNFMKISLNESSKISNSNFSLVRTIKPSGESLKSIIDYVSLCQMHIDITPTIETYPTIYKYVNSKNDYINKIEFRPYFNSNYSNLVNKIDGEEPTSFNEVILNKKAYDILNQDIFYLNHETHIDYKLDNKEVISDSYILNFNFKVVGIIDEFQIVDVPLIYYSYDYFEEEIKNIRLENLSNYFNRDISLYDRLYSYTYPNDSFSSNYYVLEVNDINDVIKVYNGIKNVNYENNYFEVNNDSLKLLSSFNDLFTSIYKVISIFIYITIIISILLLGLSLDSLVSDYKIDLGILMSCGILKDNLKLIFIFIGLIIGLSSVILSSVFYFIFSHILNNYLLNGVSIISIPYKIDILIFLRVIFLSLLFSIVSSSASLLRINFLEIGEILREE